MNNTNHTIPYEVLLDKYLEAQRDIEYLEYKISSLNEELNLMPGKKPMKTMLTF